MNEKAKQIWLQRRDFILSEYSFGPLYQEYDVEGNLKLRVTPQRYTTFLNGDYHGVDVTIWGDIYYYYKGVRVPAKYICTPEKLTIEEVFGNTNSEIVFAGCEIIGYDKIIKMKGVEIVHQDVDKLGFDRTLFRLNIGAEDPLMIVMVTNSTPEPEGHHKKYYIPVPPNMERCQQAVAWTFYKEENEYDPILET